MACDSKLQQTGLAVGFLCNMLYIMANRDVDEIITQVMDRLLDVTHGAMGCAATGELGIMAIHQPYAFIDLVAGKQAEVMA